MIPYIEMVWKHFKHLSYNCKLHQTGKGTIIYAMSSAPSHCAPVISMSVNTCIYTHHLYLGLDVQTEVWLAVNSGIPASLVSAAWILISPEISLWLQWLSVAEFLISALDSIGQFTSWTKVFKRAYWTDISRDAGRLSQPLRHAGWDRDQCLLRG